MFTWYCFSLWFFCADIGQYFKDNGLGAQFPVVVKVSYIITISPVFQVMSMRDTQTPRNSWLWGRFLYAYFDVPFFVNRHMKESGRAKNIPQPFYSAWGRGIGRHYRTSWRDLPGNYHECQCVSCKSFFMLVGFFQDVHNGIDLSWDKPSLCLRIQILISDGPDQFQCNTRPVSNFVCKILSTVTVLIYIYNLSIYIYI